MSELHAVPDPAPAADLHRPAACDPDALVAAHLALVGHLARDVARRWPVALDPAVLSSTGVRALTEAARCWDPTEGVPFPRWAAVRVRVALDDLPRRAGRDAVVVPASAAVRATVLGLRPTARSDASPGGPGSLAVASERESLGRVDAAVAALPAPHRQVVRGYFFDGRCPADLGTELGVGEARVADLRAEALCRLRTVTAGRREPAPTGATSPVAAERRTQVASTTARRSPVRSLRVGAGSRGRRAARSVEA